jgi:hypothetical protein
VLKTLLRLASRLVTDLPSALRVACRLWRSLLCGGSRIVGDGCNALNNPVVCVPDPLIYDQYYLMSLGLPITWDNPDITIWLGGAQVAPSDLQPDTTYQVVARIWNNSVNAPIVALPVNFSYLSFGVGTESHPIGNTTVNLGVKGGPDQPAFAIMPWTTPSIGGHYCIQVRLEPITDADWHNNLGQENTHVAVAHSAAVSTFELRNDTDRLQVYEFRVDAYQIGEPPPCSQVQRAMQTTAQSNVSSRLAYLSTQLAGRSSPVPSGWRISVSPERPELAALQAITVQVTIEPPVGFAGSQRINVHAFRVEVDRAQTATALAGGVTFAVSAS